MQVKNPPAGSRMLAVRKSSESKTLSPKIRQPSSKPSDSDATAASAMQAPVVDHAAARRLMCHSSCM